MHGKIMVYIDSTGRGTVMDLRKTFFDFNSQSWHDKKSIPSVGIFVEFSADSTNRITSIKPSKFQEFKDGDFVTENDFWRTESDYELDNVVQAKRAEYVTQIYRTTDFNTLDHIPLATTIPQAVQKYFKHEITAVDILKNSMDALEKKPPLILNYFVCKKFILKALDTLFYMETSLNQSEFSEIRNTTTRLEASYNDMKDRQKNINITRIFNEMFLSEQVYYQALATAIDTQKNRLKSAQLQARSARMEVNFEQQKPRPDKEKIQARQDKIIKLNEEAVQFQANIERLEKARVDFYNQHLETFERAFKLMRERLFQKIIASLDVCATLMDMKIYTAALGSAGLKNSYFSKENICNSFCTISFAELYLSRLDKYQLNENDQRLNSYVSNIIKQHRKKFLIVSTDAELIIDLKIKIFEMGEYYLVKSATKETNFQQMMRDESFDLVYIDQNTAWESPADIILKGKNLDRYDKAKFKVI